MTRYIIYLVITLTAFTNKLSAKEWLTYERCELAEGGDVEGDYFTVKAGTGYTYVFHLYGIDCPEMDNGAKKLLAEQTKKFKLEEEDVFKWGGQAADFVRDFLSKPFIVFTQKIKAPGSGNKSSYYAIVVNGEGARLDEALVKAGLARTYGTGAGWEEPFWGKLKVDLPRRISSKRFVSKLHALESKAKRERIGVWGR